MRRTALSYAGGGLARCRKGGVARPCSPSLWRIERRAACYVPCWGTLGRCALISRSAGASRSRKGPPFLWPGLRSKVSVWLGPPLIHRRMQLRLRSLLLATSAASVSSQPDIEAPTAPAEASFNQSRRDNCERQVGLLLGTVLSSF